MQYDRARTDHRAGTDGDPAHNYGPRTQRSPLVDRNKFLFPRAGSRAFDGGMAIIDEHHAMPDENILGKGDTGADKGVALDSAAGTQDDPSLNFDERPDHAIVADGAAIEVGKGIQLYASAEDYIRGNAAKGSVRVCAHRAETGTIWPRWTRDSLAAARTRTTPSPNSPLAVG